jgi:hypothetical protein
MPESISAEIDPTARNSARNAARNCTAYRPSTVRMLAARMSSSDVGLIDSDTRS